MSDTTKLRELLAKATPGPWRLGEYDDCGGYDCMTAAVSVGKARLDCASYGQHWCTPPPEGATEKMMADAELIAAMHNALPALLDAADRADALEAELAGLTENYEERTAYTIVHRGQALVCSDAMRGAYSDEHHRANRAEAELAALKASIEAAPAGEIVRVRFDEDDRPTWHIVDDRESVPINEPKRVRLLPIADTRAREALGDKGDADNG